MRATLVALLEHHDSLRAVGIAIREEHERGHELLHMLAGRRALPGLAEQQEEIAVVSPETASQVAAWLSELSVRLQRAPQPRQTGGLLARGRQ